jgi:hypothetical protein
VVGSGNVLLPPCCVGSVGACAHACALVQRGIRWCVVPASSANETAAEAAPTSASQSGWVQRVSRSKFARGSWVCASSEKHFLARKQTRTSLETLLAAVLDAEAVYGPACCWLSR